MALQIGLIGLPNVGKSTAFNALTKAQNAAVANYPFCTIEPNKAVVPVPDDRLDTLAQLVGVSDVIHATIEFVDIAGLVKGASKGEGLGNQFLGNIRDADAVVHVVRCFDDPNVVHISPQPDPRTDIEIVNTELMLADLEQLERKIEKLTRQVKGDRKLRPVLETAESLQSLLAAGRPIAAYAEPDSEPYRQLVQELRFLTSKPVIYAANVDETSLTEGNEYVTAVCQIANEQGAEVVTLCARLEEELLGVDPDERQEYLALAGIEEGGLAQVIRRSYAVLDLISFFTKNDREARAWTVRQGSTAPQAAGVIHTDFEKGFIRAEVIPYETFAEYGSETAVKAAGAMRVEGKSYVVHDGDVIYFRFNV